MSEVSLERFYFALFDDGLTIKTLKLAFIDFWIQTLFVELSLLTKINIIVLYILYILLFYLFIYILDSVIFNSIWLSRFDRKKM